jgi:hypothetical protein|tara:strand:+ start:7062 stop:8900 length:1839 start_codon:yes stop_codon:yes gene_type:complete
MANNKISYTERDFVGLRTDLLRYVREQYPDLIQNANDASIFSVLLDLNAAIGDNLNYHIDRSIQETVLQYAQQRSSLFNIARTYGLKIPGNRPSVAVTDLSITVPVMGDKEDVRYEGLLRRNSQFKGAGQVFELVDDVDFSSAFDSRGFPNRTKTPNFDSNGNVINYTITKREVVVNGVTKVFKKVITDGDVRPFLKVFLPEKNVLGVTALIQKDGTSIQALPKNVDFINSDNKWYEVEALAQDKVFIPDPGKKGDTPGIKVGKWVNTNQRFVSEYTPEGFFHLTLGGGSSSAEDSLEDLTSTGYKLDLQQYMNNLSLGSAPKANTTLFIQYRVGGGKSTNVGPNSINNVATVDFSINGPISTTNTAVRESLTVNNVTSAIGGANQPTVEELRNYISFNFSAQQRAVTINDYVSRIQTMPSIYGAPAKVGVMEVENKIMINLLSYSEDGTLTSKVSTTMMRNIAEYLSDFRMLNDYISVTSAEVIDLSTEIDLVIDPGYNQAEIVTNVIDKVSSFFNPDNREMGQDIFTGEMVKDVTNQPGVINLVELRLYNKVGGEYSQNTVSQPYKDQTTKEIALIDGTIFAQPNQSFQVKFTSKDIVIRVKSMAQPTIS